MKKIWIFSLFVALLLIFSSQSSAFNLMHTHKTKTEKERLKTNFEKNVKPKILKIHEDFDEIMRDEGYLRWAKDQNDELKHAALYSFDALEICWAITEYKKYKIYIMNLPEALMGTLSDGTPVLLIPVIPVKKFATAHPFKKPENTGVQGTLTPID